VDFKKLHQDTLPVLDRLIAIIYPLGKQEGREYKIGSVRGESGRSLSINLDTGVWSDFATGEAGGDLCTLLAAKLGYAQTDAALVIQTLIEDPTAGKAALQIIDSGGGKKKSKVNPESLLGSAPTWTKDSFIMNEWGQPAGVWEYLNSDGRLIFVVCRYGDDSSKTYRPWSWDGARWVCKAHDDGRPLYNLKGLSDLPNAPVLIVEGEKCVEAAKEVLGKWYVPICWAGGAKAINKTVWTPLTGRHIVIWPDADSPGYKAALDIMEKLKTTAQSIKLINTQDLPEGSDVADMEMSGESLMAWLDSNMIYQRLPDKSVELPVGGEWKAELQLTDRGAVRNTSHNISVILLNDPYFKGRWWIEEWDGRFYIKDQQAGESEIFDARVHLSRFWNLEVADDAIYKAMEATLDSKNSIQEWIRGLVWDKTPRFDKLASNVFKIPGNPYVSEVLRLLVCGMVARAMDPGCKFDYCVILRGPQGVGKTLFFEKLGRDRYVMLYSRTTQDKDILGAVATGWVVSIEELFDTRASLRELKSMISSTVDTWRKPYHREMSSQPKRCVLVGTTDAEADFLDDMAGYRRFLIIECGTHKFDLELFESMRDQLFAEAYVRWLSVPDWYQLSTDSIKESNTVTSNWEVEDAWAGPISEFLKDKEVTTMIEVLEGALFISPQMQDSRITKRVHRVLISVGFERVRLRAKAATGGRLRAYQRREILSDTEGVA
jgi:predicted P-loop ATPase